jgi:hypothetical protein
MDAQLTAIWNLLQGEIASVPSQDYCAYLGPASAAALLPLVHQSAKAALAYAGACNDYGGSAQDALNAQNATLPAFHSDLGAYGLSLGPCSDLGPCGWTEGAGQPFGTIYVGQGASCLDPEVVKCVGYQVAAARYAFSQAGAARAACASAPNPASPGGTTPGTPPIPLPPPVTIPVGGGTFPGTPPLPPLPTPPYRLAAQGAAFFDHLKLRARR